MKDGGWEGGREGRKGVGYTSNFPAICKSMTKLPDGRYMYIYTMLIYMHQLSRKTHSQSEGQFHSLLLRMRTCCLVTLLNL